MFDTKISFGTTDKTIQDYAAKADTPTIGLLRINKMIEQIEKKHKEDKGTINLRYFSEKKEGYFTRGEDKETFE